MDQIRRVHDSLTHKKDPQNNQQDREHTQEQTQFAIKYGKFIINMPQSSRNFSTPIE